jgi:hypothetical protein
MPVTKKSLTLQAIIHSKQTTMMRHLFLALMALAMVAMCSCNRNGNSGNSSQANANVDSTLCQFSNFKVNKMYSCYDEERDSLYFDNTITALWPEIINGKPCTELQQALLRAMTDSAELNQLDQVIDFLLNPSNYYSDYFSGPLVPVNAVKDDENKLSSSEIKINMESMTDRLLTYHLGTYSYLAGAAHGIYGHNYVTYDMKTEKAITLNDVIADTTLLRQVTLKSIKQTYDYGLDDLFIPDNGLLPLPGDFYFQDNVLHVVYQVYEIASYAQGMIDAPIYPYMLKPEEMKRLFTPYGLELTDYTD